MSEGKALSVSFEFTEEDVFHYMRDHGAYFWRVSLPVAVLFWAVALNVYASLESLIAVPLTLLGGGMSVAAGVWWYRFYVRRMARRWYRKTPGVTGECHVEIRPDGLCWSGELGNATIKWAAYTRVHGTPDQIYFYQEQRAQVYVPRRAFRTPDEAQAFLQAAKEWHAAATDGPPLQHG